jgi:hypothetical protein
METTKIQSKEVSFLKWEKTKDGGFSEDQLIDAYLEGKKTGKDEIERLIIEKLNENIELIGTQAEELIKILKDSKFNPIMVSLRVKNFNDFDVLITIPETEFVRDGFEQMYGHTSEVEQKNKSQYQLTISFINQTKSTDIEKLKADGFILHHKKLLSDRKKKVVSRKA